MFNYRCDKDELTAEMNVGVRPEIMQDLEIK